MAGCPALPLFPGRGNVTRPLSTIAGSYLAIGSESGSISGSNLERLQQKVEATKTTLETEDPGLIQALNREDLLGDLFYAGMLGYYGQFSALSKLTGAQQDGHTLLLGGLGIHGYEPKVNTLFGFPRSISPGGAVFDIPIVMSNLTDGLNQDSNGEYQQQVGQISSTLEHAVLEQLFSTEDQSVDAVSTVKALSKANAEGQRIYKMTRDNMTETLPNLNLNSETEAAIEQALLAGLEVTAHADQVSVPGWTGAGYLVLNPQTGSGAYLISGGQNGAFVLIFSGLSLALFTMLLLPGLLPLGPPGIVLFGLLMVAASSLILAGVNLALGNIDACNFFLGVAFGALATIVGLITGPLIPTAVSTGISLVIFGGGAGFLSGRLCVS